TELITSTTALSTTFTGQAGHTYYFHARSRTATASVGDWSDPVSTTVDLLRVYAPVVTKDASGW
ncbi:MAG: hypothetical protein Q7T05_04720, partial [Dehalococcoidia bacterium]|nr:hypothetical protein [Dehalococcoidia bacterium]